jgi:endonuclease/exonuclease/phosphatase family metal-dependent hydrolase
MGKAFTDFVVTHKDADIFCFQEIFSNGESGAYKNLTNITNPNPNILQDLEKLLPNHASIFCPVHDGIYGIASFVRKGIEVIDLGEVYIHRNDAMDWNDPIMDHTRKMQWIRINASGKEMMIMSLHGFHSPTKTDCPERSAQTRIIVDFLRGIDVPYILVGDFNMTLETESTRMIEKEARNLIREYGITSTRNSLYKKSEKYADFVFVSKGISVTSFNVQSDLVSDHCPLILEYESD